MIQLERGKHVATRGYRNVSVRLSKSQVASVFKFHLAQGFEGLHVPIRQRQGGLQGGGALRGLDKSDALRSGLEQRGAQRQRGVEMRHESLADGPIEERP